MFYIILAAVLFLALFIGLGYDTKQNRWRMNGKQFLSILGLIPLVFASFVMINANTVGVLFDPLNGGTQDFLLQEGLKVKIPYQRVYALSTEVNEMTFEEISVQTSDSQWLKTTVQIQISIDKDKAFDYFRKYRDKDFDQIQTLLRATTQKELERQATKYSIYEILGGVRDDIVRDTQTSMEALLAEDGIILKNFAFLDTDAGQTIEDSIALEAAAGKEATAIKVRADAEAAAIEAIAQAEANALLLKAQKQKEANDLLLTTLTPEMLEKLKIDLYSEKWDGILPQVVAGDGSGLIIDISGVDQPTE